MNRTPLARVDFSPGYEDPRGGDWRSLLGIADVHRAADNLGVALDYYERALVAARGAGASAPDLLTIELKRIDTLHRRLDHAEALAAARERLSTLDRTLEPVAHARVLARVGIALCSLSHWEEARASCLAAHEVLERTDAAQEVAALRLTLGVVAHRQGDVAGAEAHYESALHGFQAIDDREGIARVLNNLGTLLLFTPRWQEGRAYLSRAMSVAEESGNYARIASLCLNLGVLAYMTCDWSGASTHLNRALAISRETAPTRTIRAQLALGRMKLRRRDFAAAESHFLEACDLARGAGWRREEALALEFLGERALRQGALAQAAAYLDRALAIARSVAPDVVGELETRRAELALARGDAAAARDTAERALVLCSALEDAVEAGRALRIRGEAELALGLVDEARASLDQAILDLDATPDGIEQILARVARARCEVSGRVAENGWAATDGAPPATTLEQCGQRFLELEVPSLAVDCLVERARALEAAGSLDDALAAVDRARALATDHGYARPDLLLDVRAQLEARYATAGLASPLMRRGAEARTLRPTTPLDAPTRTPLEDVVQRIDADRILLVLQPHDQSARIAGSHGFVSGAPGATTLASLLAALDGEETILVIGELERDLRLGLPAAFVAGVGAAAAVPLRLPDGDRGVLYADRRANSPAGRFRVGDIALLAYSAGVLAESLLARPHADVVPASPVQSPAHPDPEDALGGFLTSDPELKRSLHLLRRLGRSGSGVLVTGETGTGKGLLSRLIHESSPRSHGPFVPINCAALPESLLESELFGHEQGAFTGALRTKRGLFEEAAGGTIFLDEVDKAPLTIQAKLLHVLDQHEIRPVGSTHWKRVDVRVVCATNVDLMSAIAAGRFLQDLYYRLNDFQVHIPPLRERRGDIPLLVRYFVETFRDALGRPHTELTPEAVNALTGHDWRGNVRELEKVIKRVLVLAEDGEQITVDALPRDVRVGLQAGRTSHTTDGTLRSAVERLEADLIGRTLDASGGNKSEVARRLQVSYPCLLSKIKKYGLEARAR